MVYGTFWHSQRKFELEDFIVFGCQSKDRSIIVLMKTVHIMVFGWSLEMVASFMFRLNTEANIKCLDEVMLPWIKRVATGRTLPHATQAREPTDPVTCSVPFQSLGQLRIPTMALLVVCPRHKVRCISRPLLLLFVSRHLVRCTARRLLLFVSHH